MEYEIKSIHVVKNGFVFNINLNIININKV